MTTKRDCSGRAYEVTGSHRCFRNATVQRDGQWWCWQHDPERVEANKKKRRAADKAKMDRYTARWERRASNSRLAALVTEETVALLERLGKEANLSYEEAGEAGDSNTDWAIQLHADDKAARALAARIREALALEANNED
jgi:hypothetical protein